MLLIQQELHQELQAANMRTEATQQQVHQLQNQVSDIMQNLWLLLCHLYLPSWHP